MKRKGPPGLKPESLSGNLRGPEGPLFHGGVDVRGCADIRRGVDRRAFLRGVTGLALTALAPQSLWAADPPRLPFRFSDITNSAGLHFQHHSGAFGGKFLPETLGSGCAFLDYDADGWQDILLVNGTDWPGHGASRPTLQLYRNNRNGTFTDVTHAAGLSAPNLYGMGVAVGDYNNDGFPDISRHLRGTEPPLSQYRQGHVRRRDEILRPRQSPGIQHLGDVV